MASGVRTSDRVVSISLSVLVHGLILGALVWGWWQYHTPKPPPAALAIQATVVRSAPEAQNTPPPTAPAPNLVTQEQQQERERAEAARAEAQRQAAARVAAERAAEQASAAKAAREQAAAAKAAEEQTAAEAAHKAQLEAQRQAEEDAARKAQLEAERKAKQEAELKAKQEAEREAQRIAQQLQAEQTERQRESDLRKQLQVEEHLQALQSSPAKAEYLALIQARISRAWTRPPSASSGARCTVHLTQIPGGEITHVSVEGCNGDDALRQSVETAAYRASPLPAPSDPALFDPNLTVTFAPDD